MNEDFYDVIIIGGGISGLTTAYRLLQHDKSLKLLVLEAKGINCKYMLQCDIYNYCIPRALNIHQVVSLCIYK